MTEYEKMLGNLPYDYTDEEIQARIVHTYEAMRALNQCGAWDKEELRRCIHDLLPNAHPSAKASSTKARQPETSVNSAGATSRTRWKRTLGVRPSMHCSAV